MSTTLSAGRLRPVLAAALLTAVLAPALAGCDAALPTEPGDLLLDARIARQAGDLDTAVDLLEQAHAADQADAIVRIELASTLFEQVDLDVADLERIASTFLEEASGGLGVAEPFATASKGNGCPYASDPAASPFDPRGVEDYDQYTGSAPVARRALALLDPIIADQLRPDDFLCTGIEDGALVYDADAALAELRGVDPRITDEQIASTLAVNAVAEVLGTYVFLTEDLADETAWYRLGDGSIGVCPVGITEAELRARTEPSIADLGEALLSIDLRGQLVGSSTELVTIVLDAYESVRHNLAPACPDA